MKKILLLGLVAIGMSAATMSARANGFEVAVTLSRPCPLIFAGPFVPIVAPPTVVFGGCEPTVIVRDCDRGHFVACGPERFHNRVVERRDYRFHH
jgi:hypothetical protein